MKKLSMEQVNDVINNTLDTLEEELLDFGIPLEDALSDTIWEFLEEKLEVFSNGVYENQID